MKSSLLIIIALVFTSQIYAQENNDDKKYFLGVSYGKSFPLGDFKSTDANGDNSGFAKTGNKFDLFGGYYLDKSYGINALVRYQTYGTNATSLGDELHSLSPNINYAVESTDWKFTSVLVGGFYNVPVSKKMSLHPKAMIGFMFGYSPEIAVSATDGSTTGNLSTESANAAGFAFEFGLGLESKLGKHFALMPTFDFSGGFPSFSDVKTTYASGGSVTRTYNPAILTFNLGLAIAYRF